MRRSLATSSPDLLAPFQGGGLRLETPTAPRLPICHLAALPGFPGARALPLPTATPCVHSPVTATCCQASRPGSNPGPLTAPGQLLRVLLPPARMELGVEAIRGCDILHHHLSPGRAARSAQQGPSLTGTLPEEHPGPGLLLLSPRGPSFPPCCWGNPVLASVPGWRPGAAQRRTAAGCPLPAPVAPRAEPRTHLMALK